MSAFRDLANQGVIKEYYSSKKILITGGRGYLGSCLTESLSASGSIIHLVDHSPTPWLPSNQGNVHLVNGDICDVSSFERIVTGVDVIFHLAEDDVFTSYMKTLFESSTKYVVVYSSNTESNDEKMGGLLPQIRHRKFTDWVEQQMPAWELIRRVPNRYPFQGDSYTGSFSDFYIYQQKGPT